MTVFMLMLGGLIATSGILALGGLGVYAKVMLDPGSSFSQDMRRLFELHFTYRGVAETQAGEIQAEAAEPAPDRPTRLAVAGKTLEQLVYGDTVKTNGQLYTVVAAYVISKLEQRGGSKDWVPEGSEYMGFELHPVDDDPQGRGGGFFVMQLPTEDDRDVQWVSLNRIEYGDPDRDVMYEAAKTFGKLEGRNQTAFTLQAAEGSWTVRDIGTSSITTGDVGGTFTGTTRVAHVMMRSGNNTRAPHSIAVWFDFRPEQSVGTGNDTLAVGQVIDPQQVGIF